MRKKKVSGLVRLVSMAKNHIFDVLHEGPLSGKQLETQVLSWLNIRTTKHHEIRHETKPIHVLAYIIAYKNLEEAGQITISRSAGVPFPMTDYATTFTLKEIKS